MFKVIMALAPLLWAGMAAAADMPQYGPPPAWVEQAPIPAAPAKASDTAVQLLLMDSQMRFGTDDEFYLDRAFRILTPAGLAGVNGLNPSWDPQTETLILHRFEIVRDGRTIDLLGGGSKVTVVRREKNLELAMLDGDLTAVLQPTGVRVGDVIEIAYSIIRHDPVFRGMSQGAAILRFPGVATRVRIRAVWPTAKAMQWRASAGVPRPKVVTTADGSELVIDVRNFVAPKTPSGAPTRYQEAGILELSQFRSWSDVSALMAPLYDRAETLASQSPLKAEAAKIAAASADPKARAEAALRLVQDKVRYAFVGMNLGGLVPADADVTWSRRFGDCKGKTVLLLALLHELGIEAQPALVSTVAGDGLERWLPELSFDHVIVRAHIDGKDYWLDGTRLGDRGLDDIAIPDFHWVLPVQKAGAQLVDLIPPPLSRPDLENVVSIDDTKGLDTPATIHAESIWRGDAAVAWNLGLTAVGPGDAERAVRNYWSGRLSWATIAKVGFAFDAKRREMRFTMDGTGAMDWGADGGSRSWRIDDSSLGFEPSFNREPSVYPDAPYAVAYPDYETWKVTLALPDKGAGFGLLQSEPVDQTIAEVRYRRQSRIENGVVTMLASQQSLAPEFPAAQASSAAETLRKLYAYDIAVVAPQAPIAVAESVAPPTDAAGLVLQAGADIRARNYAGAISDLDQAIKLDPKSSEYVYNRGVAHFEAYQDDLALSDFDKALSLDPKNELALEARGRILLGRGDAAGARRAFEQAASLAPDDTSIILREASAYYDAGRDGDAARLYGELIAKKPSGDLYNDRCWLLARDGRQLAAALADCDAALKLEPGAPAILDSRGFVELRMGRYQDSLRDYEAALDAKPNQAESLLGRGIVELRLGKTQPGQADIDAARNLDAGVLADFARVGVKP